MSDQAQRLRQLAEHLKGEIRAVGGASNATAKAGARLVAITSGKGGVGKTNVSANLGMALVQLGYRVIVVDADLGLANVDVLLGTHPRYNLSHVLRGEVALADAVYAGPAGLSLIAAAAGIEELADVPRFALTQFLEQLTQLARRYDFLLLDTGAGISRQVLGFLLGAHQVLVVTTPEPTSLADAYAIIKLVRRQQPNADIRLIVNQAESRGDGERAANQLSTASLRFLGAEVPMLGVIPVDASVGEAVRAQQTFVLRTPMSPASRAIVELARTLVGDRPREGRQSLLERIGRFFALSSS